MKMNRFFLIVGLFLLIGMFGLIEARDFNIFNTSNLNQSFFLVNGNGNVGIGTTTPQNTLNIIGDLNVTGNIYGSAGNMIDSSPDSDLQGTGMITEMNVYANSYGIGACLYMGGNDLVMANGDNATLTVPCMAMALETGTGTKRVLLQGYMRNDAWNWSVGSILYVSTTDGVITSTAPSGSGDLVQVIGIATHADRIYFNPDLTVIEVV